ncbi:MAG: hypothetical protein KatS3mg060_1907 [Dehalococcoidia bacterium]|nr:MAG: hypothetical protein KatS3mg060_1907 [Dehalococcoidia bacterium]
MIPWQLHEFRIAPGQRDQFLDLWRTRLLPLAERHGPCVAGCWTEGDDRFLWLTSCSIRPTDDALAEDWPAMLGRHRGLGTMDVSRVLSELDFSPLGARLQGGTAQPLPHRVYVLDEQTLQPGGAPAAEAIARDYTLPLLREVGMDLVGAWRCQEHGHDNLIFMLGFRNEEERKTKLARLTADPRYAEIRRRLDGVLTGAKGRVLQPCDFSPLGPVSA